MSGLTWLHLSDWHQKDVRFDPKVVRDRLVKDIEGRTAVSPVLDKIDFIIFSGDVASKAQAEEYKAAKKEFFDYLLEASEVSPRRLFIVPGNHDLDGTALELLPDEFKRDSVAKEDVDLWLEDTNKREQLLRPFEEFKNFVADYTGQDSPDYSNVRILRIDGKRIALMCLNSAWWCRRHKNEAGKFDDFGFVLVGEPQIHKPLDQISDADLRIGVLHHSQEWLVPFDGHQVWSRLKQECDFILHGHGHTPKVTVEHSTTGDCVIIPAGASFDRRIAREPQFTNSYNFVHLDLETGKGTVFLRRWINSRTEWARDDETYLEGRFDFDLHTKQIGSPSRSILPTYPHQIPPPKRDFTGRDEELKSLLGNFDRGAAITGLRGMGGIGKTELAFVLADKLADRYPHGQIFVDMKGTDPKPLTPAEGMAQVIRSYDPEFEMPESEAELKGQYFSILHGKRALLLFDNAASGMQVRPLIPPTTCGVIITSRPKFALASLEQINLDKLKDEDAVRLLMRVLKPSICEEDLQGRDDTWDKIARLCGNLPLALRAAGSLLANSSDLSLEDYAMQLQYEHTRLENIGSEGVDLDVKANFNLSYARLPDETRQVFRQLSIFSSDFDSKAEEMVCQDDGHRHLSSLLRWSLVEYIVGVSRYHMHSLVRIFAADRLEEEGGDSERDTAQQCHAEHFKDILSACDELYIHGGKKILDGLKQLDREWANVQEGYAWAEKNTAKNANATRLCSSYPEAGIHVLALRQHPRDRIRWSKAGLVAARLREDRKSEGFNIGILGRAYADLGETRKAIENLEQSLAIHREIGNHSGEGSALNGLCQVYAALGDIRKAVELGEQALVIHHEIEDRRGEANALDNLGGAYSKLGDNRLTIELGEQALVIHREIGDRRGEANTLGNLGGAYSKLGDSRRAIEFIRMALAIYQEMGDRRGEANALGNLGGAYSKLGDSRRAIELGEQALMIHREIEDRRGEANALGNLGGAYSKLGDNRRAIELGEQALMIHREIEDRRGEANTLGNLGGAYSKLGDNRRAIELGEQALVICQEIGDRRGEANTLGGLGNAYSALGKLQKSINFYARFLSIAEEIGDRRGIGYGLGRLSVAWLLSGDTHQAIEFANRELAIHRVIGDRRGEATALAGLGRIHTSLGDPHGAIEFYEEALRLNREIGDRRAEASILSSLGGAYATLVNAPKAADFYNRALLIYQEIRDPRGEGNTLWKMSRALYMLGQEEMAIELAETALEIFNKIQSLRSTKVRRKLAEWKVAKQGVQAVKASKIHTYIRPNGTRNAVERFKLEVAIAQEKGERRSEGIALAKLGQAYIDMGVIRVAIKCLEQSLAIAQEAGNLEDKRITLTSLGSACANVGETQKATDYYEQALVISREIGDRQDEGISLVGLGRIYVDLRDMQKAIEYYEQALVIAREIEDTEGEGNALWCISLALSELGQQVHAAEYANKALRIFEEIKSPNEKEILHKLAQWHEQEKFR